MNVASSNNTIHHVLHKKVEEESTLLGDGGGEDSIVQARLLRGQCFYCFALHKAILLLEYSEL